MKKIIFISTLLLLALCSFSKPIITYNYAFGILHFLNGGYDYIHSVATYEVVNGVPQCKTVDVTCKVDGSRECVAVYRPAAGPNPFTEPEENLMLALKMHVKTQISSGIMSGSYSVPITIQSGDNNPETYVYTIIWGENAAGEGQLTIKNEKVN